MKTKRQTIWLVSMLSLMVVLSAYYLFTEDSSTKVPQTADGQQVTVSDTSGANGAALTGENADGSVATEITDDSSAPGLSAEDQADAAVDPGTGTEATDNSKAAGDTAAANDTDGAQVKDPAAANTDKDASAAADKAKSDEEVLQTVEAQGTAGSDQITEYQYSRDESYAKQEDNLLQAMNDFSKTPEENAKAGEELNALQDKEAKITSIEEQITQKFGNAVVAEEDNGYKVVIMNDKLEAKQAASIIDMVISELGVSQEKVKVQYITGK